jgi:hypothetical protein
MHHLITVLCKESNNCRNEKKQEQRTISIKFLMIKSDRHEHNGRKPKSPIRNAKQFLDKYTSHTTQCESFLRALTFVSPVKKDDSILHCGCVEKMAYFHGVYLHEGNPMTRNGYGTHDGYGV